MNTIIEENCDEYNEFSRFQNLNKTIFFRIITSDPGIRDACGWFLVDDNTTSS